MVYYNEHDAKAAAWLRQLIADRWLPAGDVDTRSITDVRAHELAGYIQCHFFAGIGGWPLALRLAGVPDDEPVWTGSPPCQPFSDAGKRLGNADSRHLFPPWRRLIAKRRPAIVLGEQVASEMGREWLARVRVEMETLGYGVGCVDACSPCVQAPNIRARLYWMGYTDDTRPHQGKQAAAANGHGSPALANGDFRRLDLPVIPRLEGHARNGHAPAELRNGAEPGPHGPASAPGDALGAMWYADVQRRTRESFGFMGPSCPGYWDAFDILHCLDGKSRRIEPGTFPLASRVSGRVVKLRGYGNAINPILAASFIQAAAGALIDHRSGGMIFED